MKTMDEKQVKRILEGCGILIWCLGIGQMFSIAFNSEITRWIVAALTMVGGGTLMWFAYKKPKGE